MENDISEMEKELISRGYSGLVDKIDPIVQPPQKCTMHLLEDEEEYPDLDEKNKPTEEEDDLEELVL